MKIRLLVLFVIICCFFGHDANAFFPPSSEKDKVLKKSNLVSDIRNGSGSKRLLSKNVQKKKTTFVSNQIIVKFKDSVTQPADALIAQNKSVNNKSKSPLEQLISKYGVSSAMPVFTEDNPTRNKNSKSTINEPHTTADIKQRFEERLNDVKQRFPKRTNRASKGMNSPSLHNLHVLTFDSTEDPAVVAAEFAKNPDVEYAQPNYKMQVLIPNDPYYFSHGSWRQPFGWEDYDDLWGLKKIQPDQIWDTNQGDSVVVAVVDTGLDFNHPDIKDNIWTNPTPGVSGSVYANDLHGWDFTRCLRSDENGCAQIKSPGTDIMDYYGHGTHVAGIIAAHMDNAIDGQFVGIIGVAPKAKIMTLKGLSTDGTGLINDLAEAIKYAVDHGADVINNSWGCTQECPSMPVVEDVVSYAYSAGVVVVFAAGNSNDDVIHYSPENTGLPITVSASDQADHKCGFSNFGAVDIAAPGCGSNSAENIPYAFYNVLSLKSSQISPLSGLYPYLNDLTVGGQYLRLAGTSMAAPFVSGAVALLLHKNPTWTIEQVRQALRHGAIDVEAPGVDTFSGYGRLNVSNSLRIVDPPELLITSPLENNLGKFSTVSVWGIINGVGLQEWTLAYGDGETPTAWTNIISSTTPVASNGKLADWDLSQVPDGLHILRLTVIINTASGPETYSYQRNYSTEKLSLDSIPNSATAGAIVTVKGDITTDVESYSVKVATYYGGTGSQDILFTPFITQTKSSIEKGYQGPLAIWDTSSVNFSYWYKIIIVFNLASGASIERSTNDIEVNVPDKILTIKGVGTGQGNVDAGFYGDNAWGTCLNVVNNICHLPILSSYLVTAVPIANTGSLFKGWQSNFSCINSDCSFFMDQDNTITAQFDILDPTPPTAPSELTVTPTSSGSVDLRWNVSTSNNGIKGYKIYRNDNNVNYAMVYDSQNTETSWTDSSTISGATYNYYVVAYDLADQSSAQSNTATIKLPWYFRVFVSLGDGRVTSAPSGIDCSRTTGINGPVISGTCTAQFSSPTLTLTFQDTNPKYIFSMWTGQASACPSTSKTCTMTLNNNSALSATARVALDTQPPSVPTNLLAQSITASSIKLGWGASTDKGIVGGYKIFRNNIMVYDTQNIGTSWTDGSVSPGASYSYFVKAYDGAGNISLQGNTISIITPALPAGPTGLSATVNKSKGTVALTWTAPTGGNVAGGYQIYRNGVELGTSSTTSYTDKTRDIEACTAPSKYYVKGVINLRAKTFTSPSETYEVPCP